MTMTMKVGLSTCAQMTNLFGVMFKDVSVTFEGYPNEEITAESRELLNKEISDFLLNFVKGKG